MICPSCRASVADGLKFCSRCRKRVRPDDHPVVALFKQYPWLAVLLAGSAAVTIWAATRRVPEPEVIPPSPPAVEASAPAPEPEETPAPPMPALLPAPEAKAEPEPVRPVRRAGDGGSAPPIMGAPMRQNDAGAWGGGSMLDHK